MGELVDPRVSAESTPKPTAVWVFVPTRRPHHTSRDQPRHLVAPTQYRNTLPYLATAGENYFPSGPYLGGRILALAGLSQSSLRGESGISFTPSAPVGHEILVHTLRAAAGPW